MLRVIQTRGARALVHGLKHDWERAIHEGSLYDWPCELAAGELLVPRRMERLEALVAQGLTGRELAVIPYILLYLGQPRVQEHRDLILDCREPAHVDEHRAVRRSLTTQITNRRTQQKRASSIFERRRERLDEQC